MAVSVMTNVGNSRPVAYTPVLTNGSNGTPTAFWWRNDVWLWVDGLITWTNAGEAGALAIALPTGLVMNTALLTGTTNADAQLSTLLGFGQWRDAGTQFEPLAVLYASTTTVNLAENSQLIFGNQMANTDSLKFTFKVPILGW